MVTFSASIVCSHAAIKNDYYDTTPSSGSEERLLPLLAEALLAAAAAKYP